MRDLRRLRRCVFVVACSWPRVSCAGRNSSLRSSTLDAFAVDGADGKHFVKAEFGEFSTMPDSALLVSTLLTATSTGLPLRASAARTSRSSGTMPSCTLTTKMMTSADSIASSTCSMAALMMTSSAFSRRSRPMPPVSTSVKGWPCHSTSALMRSRVTPGWSCTMAMRRPTMRLNSADLPTLGRPTMAISPDMG